MLNDLIMEITQLKTDMELHGFIAIERLNDKRFKKASKSGFIMLVKNSIIGRAIADCSHLYVVPYLIFQPRTVTQLSIIVRKTTELGVPITFASGKTGLSGGYLNPYVVVDLENLETIRPAVQIDKVAHAVYAAQKVTLGELMTKVRFETDGQYLFPTQPSSAFKLPVRLGGAVATNASGVTSGKLGPIKDWINTLEFMDPKGQIKECTHEDPHFDRIVGGMGKYGVVLAASIRLAKLPENLSFRICYGNDIKALLGALEEIRLQKVFPLINEFVMSPDRLRGKFNQMESDPLEPIRWAILLKGNSVTLNTYLQIIREHTKFRSAELSGGEFQEFLEERTAMAIMALPDVENEEYIRFPGFEDVLIPPLDLWDIYEQVNVEVKKFGFPEINIPYGHLNFRKGLGVLLHLRMPVKVVEFCEDAYKTKLRIARAMARINYLLYIEMGLTPKAEHTVGSFEIGLNAEKIERFTREIRLKNRFPDPHLLIYNHAREHIITKFPEIVSGQSKEYHIKILELLIFGYLSGEFKLKLGKSNN